MYSIIEQGGVHSRSPRVVVIRVPHFEAESGAEVTIEKVLMTGEGANVKIGTPTIQGATVTAKVVDQIKDKKVLVIKRKRRKDYRRKNGHRQQYTRLEIVSINA